MAKKQYTVKSLIEELKKFPEDHKVEFYERGGCYNTQVSKAYISRYDRDHNVDTVTLSH